MASMLKIVRTCAAITGSAMAVMVATALPAGADSASGLVDHAADVAGFPVNVGDGDFADLPTALIGLRLDDDTTLGVYCIQIDTEIDEEQKVVEKAWEAYPEADSPFNQNRGKINWILHNGSPVKDAAELTQLVTASGAILSDQLDETEAVTGTQAAIWHFSDGVDLDREDPLPGDDSDEGNAQDVLALYDFLIGDQNKGIEEQPTPSLALDPTALSGTAGERIGPFTVQTNGQVQEIGGTRPEGVKVTDKDGNELNADMVENGTELFLDVPGDEPEGSAIIELKATAVVETGRLFVSENYAEEPSQTLIVAESVETEIVASAAADWAEASPEVQGAANTNDGDEDGGLASTGASILVPVLLGVGLLVLGGTAVGFVRSRRTY